MTQLDHLRDLIARDEYAIDAEQVAEAMLRRLMLEATPRSG